MDWPVALSSSLGFCMLHNWIKLLASIDDVVLRQDTSNCMITKIRFHYCLMDSVELGKDGSCKKSCSEFYEGLLLSMSPSEMNIFYLLEQWLCLSTVVDNESSVIVCKAKECLHLLLFCRDWPLGGCFKFGGIHLDFLIINDMLQEYGLITIELALE